MVAIIGGVMNKRPDSSPAPEATLGGFYKKSKGSKRSKTKRRQKNKRRTIKRK